MRRHTHYRSKAQTLIEIAIVLVLLCVAAGMWVGRPARRLAAAWTPDTLNHTSPFQITGTPTAPPATTGGTMRRVYGHSLVAGGIHSVDELMTLIQRDPLLAGHYRNFDLSKAHIITLDHDVVAYVSYRLAQGIYWQARPAVIARGEQVITDGANFIRARCGNRISYVPGFPISPGEPEDIDNVVEVRLIEPPVSTGPTAAYATTAVPTIPGTSPAVPLTGSLGNISSPGESSPPVPTWGISGGGGAPLIPPAQLSNPASQFTADEFSSISFAILGHSFGFPSKVVARLAGVLLVISLSFALRK